MYGNDEWRFRVIFYVREITAGMLLGFAFDASFFAGFSLCGFVRLLAGFDGALGYHPSSGAATRDQQNKQSTVSIGTIAYCSTLIHGTTIHQIQCFGNEF
ncbi:hypothetical protein AX760_13665 [Pararhizobium antarcticum]|uniref:Uncharacterized protein n=1 Tax=Pararhizobium antarcticum TaxID=1798805 RepID=A0A657LVC6_9HYPH|nr:hypothetical protein AX760_13665 [Pararhizobium antarcticum]OJG00174.1 hypothetical protein AX761_24770 [Rhizobium sp. 58]